MIKFSKFLPSNFSISLILKYKDTENILVNQNYELGIPNTTNAIDGHFADLKNKRPLQDKSP
ncbi:hypothetical protein CCAND93_160001 [Capnocytophaga canis]|uniref:Uncharacterized protein n=1 Tax=Capnocytophaga canis TaxID=1848903 RepID=A0A0B7IMV3_9FLAO|nr:hypothetical protein CCAND93_160001 [Capnocytophaga canis]